MDKIKCIKKSWEEMQSYAKETSEKIKKSKMVQTLLYSIYLYQ